MPRPLLLLPLLLSLALTSCLSQADSEARAEYDAVHGTGFIRVSEKENTYVEVASHWTGAFGGAAHWEHAVFYCKGGNWWWEPAQRAEVYYTEGGEAPTLRLVAPNLVEVTPHPAGLRGDAGGTPFTFTLSKPWPDGHRLTSHIW